jgi:hypothetical protein
MCADNPHFFNHSEDPTCLDFGPHTTARYDLALGTELTSDYRSFCRDPFLGFPDDHTTRQLARLRLRPTSGMEYLAHSRWHGPIGAFHTTVKSPLDSPSRFSASSGDIASKALTAAPTTERTRRLKRPLHQPA